MIDGVTKWLAGFSSLLSAPVAVAHEATHCLVAAAAGCPARLEVAFDEAEAYSLVDLDDAGRLVATVACLAPTLLGHALALVVVAWWLATGGDLPTAIDGWARLALAGIVWGVYSSPSGRDLARARDHAQGGER